MHIHDAEGCVRLVPIFKNLDAGTITAIAQLVHEHNVAAGDTLFLAGTDADALYIVARGQVKVTQDTVSGREQMLRLLQAGDFDGEAVLFTKTEHNNNAIALTASQVCTISRSDFQQLLRQSPDLALNVLNALGQRVVTLENQATAANTASVAERLANYLLETSAAMGDAEFTLPLRKKDLALYLGTSAETISRRLTTFEDDGLIEQSGRGHIKIVDADGLGLVI
ncbi:Crp/Fnr family transcriptional regulator [Lacticaseibacillus hulanensis]|jgi:CRP/FNR family transcriptional regulator|uniref:Crp/Fnr family transcriptional regulator n=1 Tax=Lacticaseibacillus hulanensis TaxID=2493111 RepID=UPI000FD79EE7|nr:Crp/Fnr family transcriptional regulator [Lacticaseibacillus hulanensis]